MQKFSLCFGKVKKDCLKFIKSQETKADKFKNKEKMIKSFLVPLCFWINKKAEKKRPYFVGLAGGQGTGKTTISSLIRIILTKYFKLNVLLVSSGVAPITYTRITNLITVIRRCVQSRLVCLFFV